MGRCEIQWKAWKDTWKRPYPRRDARNTKRSAASEVHQKDAASTTKKVHHGTYALKSTWRINQAFVLTTATYGISLWHYPAVLHSDLYSLRDDIQYNSLGYFTKRTPTRHRLIFRGLTTAVLMARHLYELISRTFKRAIINAAPIRARKNVEVKQHTLTFLNLPKAAK